MPSRYHTDNEQRKVKTPLSRPSPGSRGGKDHKFDAESTFNWPTDIGPRGRDMNSKVKFPRVKDAAKRGGF